MEKLCVFCKNMVIADSRGPYSTWTGPYGEKGPACSKGHFSEYETHSIDDMDEYRALILKATNCPDYDPAG